MTLFEQIILESLLNEGVEVNDIEVALDQHNVVKLNYHSMTKEDIAEGERDIYPIAYGLSTAGNPVVRAYQPHGDSASNVPSWKLFRIDGIKNWDITDDVFTTRDIPDLRIKHDDGMSIEYKSAFGGTSKDAPKIEKQTIDHTPVSKTEIDNLNNITQDIETLAPQNTNVANEPQRLDIQPQSTHIPVGVNPETIEAPEAKPVTPAQVTPEMEPETEPEETPEIPSSDSNSPIYQDDLEDNDEEEYNAEEDETAQGAIDLMDRMDNIKR